MHRRSRSRVALTARLWPVIRLVSDASKDERRTARLLFIRSRRAQDETNRGLPLLRSWARLLSIINNYNHYYIITYNNVKCLNDVIITILSIN